jgi:hypothetical protein
VKKIKSQVDGSSKERRGKKREEMDACATRRNGKTEADGDFL